MMDCHDWKGRTCPEFRGLRRLRTEGLVHHTRRKSATSLELLFWFTHDQGPAYFYMSLLAVLAARPGFIVRSPLLHDVPGCAQRRLYILQNLQIRENGRQKEKTELKSMLNYLHLEMEAFTETRNSRAHPPKIASRNLWLCAEAVQFHISILPPLLEGAL
jgi:hypothetical protein